MKSRIPLTLLLTLALAGAASSSLHAQILFEENFDDGTADGFTVVSGDWSVIDGTYHVYTTGYQVGSVSMVTAPGADAWTDYQFDCDLMVSGGVGHLVKFRASSADNCYEVDVRSDFYNDVYLQKRVDGALITLDVAYFPSSTKVWHHLSVNVVGPEIMVQVDGTQVCDYFDTSSPFLEGSVGLMSWAGGDIGWQELNADNVVVQVLAVPNEQSTWTGVKYLYR